MTTYHIRTFTEEFNYSAGTTGTPNYGNSNSSLIKTYQDTDLVNAAWRDHGIGTNAHVVDTQNQTFYYLTDAVDPASPPLKSAFSATSVWTQAGSQGKIFWTFYNEVALSLIHI